MLAIVTSKTREQIERRPEGPFTINWGSPQSRGLVCWVPIGNPAGNDELDLIKLLTFTNNGSIARQIAPMVGKTMLFDNSNDYLEAASAPLTVVPLTLAAWFYCNQNTALDTILAVDINTGSTNSFAIFADGATAGDPVAARTSATAGISTAVSTTGYTINKWHHACGVFDITSATDRTAYIDGGSPGTQTTNRTPSGINRTRIGGLWSGASVANLFGGWIADARIYNFNLKASEVYQLFDPRTRWELYYQLGRKLWSFPVPAAGRTTKNTRSHPLGVYVGTNWRTTGPAIGY